MEQRGGEYLWNEELGEELGYPWRAAVTACSPGRVPITRAARD